MNTTPFELDLDDLLHDLPELRRVSNVDWSEHGGTRCLVAIAGFEPRCCAAPSRLAELGWQAESSLMIRYGQEDMRDANDRYVERLSRILREAAPGRKPVELWHDDHCLEADFGEKLVDALTADGLDLTSPASHVVLDITGGSSRLLLEGLHALLKTPASLTLIYSEAAWYWPRFEDYLQYTEESRGRSIPAPEFLTVGVDKVEVLKSIPGHDADARPTFLVAFPSFSATRIGAVIEELSPSRVQWLFCIPHLVKNHWRIDAQLEYHRALVEDQHRRCYVSTFDYRESLAALECLYRKRRNDYNMLVCSLGSKLQKVGQVLFHLLRPEVGAVVSIPRTWDTDRVSDDAPRAVYCLHLGDCAELRRKLLRTRTFRI